MKAALKEKSHCSVLDKKSPFRLDIKGIYNDLDRIMLKRRVSFDYHGINIWIWSSEDAIALKLLANSEQDIKDAKSIYVRQLPTLDVDYTRKMCKKLGVEKQFEKMRRDVEKYLEELESK